MFMSEHIMFTNFLSGDWEAAEWPYAVGNVFYGPYMARSGEYTTIPMNLVTRGGHSESSDFENIFSQKSKMFLQKSKF